jgi:transcriptional regulator with GAF, ATPase, and Fis domain
MDKNAFFRNATLKICGNLALEEALHATLIYLRNYLPVDVLFAEYFDPGLGATRTIARAEVSGGTRLDLITPLPIEVREDRAFKANAIPGQAVILNHPDENRMATTMLRFHQYDETKTSIMAMQLVGEGEMFGGLIALSAHRDAFIEGHAQLFTLLAEPFKVAMVNAIQHRDMIRLKDRLADDNLFLHRELQKIAGDEIVGANFGLKSVMRLVRQAAPTESPILLTGETGVGKDVIANAIHFNSPRHEGPFIPVNCGAIPATLLDSELFGHEKGAFTGALSMKRGRFERADKGTILLDEIGEMALDAQVRLLRVIQHREVERLGGTDRIPTDIRIIAATNKDLAQMVHEGRFRKDLWYRLNVFPIVVPPLRDRTGDIPALVHHFIERKAKELKIGDTPRLADGAIDALMAYDWPGNVRELENVVERAMILHRGKPLRFDELSGSHVPQPVTTDPKMKQESLELDAVVARHIFRVLRMSGGKIHGPGGAGELLAVNPNTLRYKMQKLGIPFQKRKEGRKR